MRVKGDGLHTLEQLIRGNDKCNSRLDELRLKHGKNFERIIPEGENYILSYAGNHNRGAHFIDLSAEINEELVNILDEISTKVNDFFYGRYDIMRNSVEDLKKGRNFVILEYNGCGAEPNHFYDTGYTLTRAWKEILKHWKILYEISRYNHQQGVAYWPLMKGIQFRIDTKKYFKIAKQADKIIS